MPPVRRFGPLQRPSEPVIPVDSASAVPDPVVVFLAAVARV